MTALQKNTLANFIGRALIALMGFLFVPLYLKYMGAEAYGIIGFWATLSATLGILDLGVAATLNREMARLSARADGHRDMRDLLGTLEWINWGVAVFIALVVMGLSYPIARYWVNVKELPIPTVTQAVFLIGLVLLFQWPYTLYSSGLIGLQRQVVQNVIAVSMTALRNVGVLAILAWVSPTIQAFFLWQVGVYILQFVVSRRVLWGALPADPEPARFRPEVLKEIWRFALGMSGISLVAMLLGQTDRVILSKMISLDQFGYYFLAASVASSLGMLIGPVFTAVYPRLAQLAGAEDQQEPIRALYHRACQVVSVSIFPVAIVLCLFSHEILLLWMRKPLFADQTSTLVSLLVVGTVINGLLSMPYALQLAHGWTSLTFGMNLVAVLILVPSMILMILQWGAVGAAIAWVAVNTGNVLTVIHLMHRRLLRGDQWRWYGQDVGMPAVGGLTICLVARMVIRPEWPIAALLVGLGLTCLVAMCAAASLAPATRPYLYGALKMACKGFRHA